MNKTERKLINLANNIEDEPRDASGKWTKHGYSGNCKNSFDKASGDCIVGDLPFNSVSDLGVADEEATEIKKDEFLNKVHVPEELNKKLIKHKLKYLKYDNLYMIYDDDKDVHYFFTANR